MSDQNTDAKTNKSGRIQKYLLIGSLAVNFLVLGAVVGGVLSKDHRHMRPPQGEFAIGPFTRALSDEDKQVVQENLRRQIEKRGYQDRRKAREVLRDLIAAIRAEPFDPTQVATQFDNMSNLSKSRRVQGETAMIDAIAKMSSAERQAYADRLEQQFRKGREGDRKTPSNNN